MSEALLARGLDELVPEPEVFGDWDDVLRRAGVRGSPEPAPQRHPRRRGVVLLLAAIGVAVPAAALVAAVVTRTDVVFSHAKPAPNVVKKQFADLDVGAPPRFAQHVDAARAREVGTFDVRGRKVALWVAPTRRGGFCFTFERSFGGCRGRTPQDLAHPLDAFYGASVTRGHVSLLPDLGGTVLGGDVARLEVEYADGSRDDVPFVYVSRPIDAGFFRFSVPKEHLVLPARVVAVVARDKDGHVLARQEIELTLRPSPAFVGGRLRRPPPRKLPSAPPAAPSRPLQRGAANGVSVVVGANGMATFHAERVDPRVRPLLRGYVSYSCFRLVREFGIFDDKGLGTEGAFGPVVGLAFNGLGTPLDGCEIEGSYGHRWPDRNGSHSAVEIPLTSAGRRFFVDRAAARDLSLLVRSRRVQKIRRERGAALDRGLAPYGIQRISSPRAPLEPGRIGYAAGPEGVTFVERSPTGRRFFVEVRRGRIVRANVKPYALVF
jgi:hypothetical protein